MRIEDRTQAKASLNTGKTRVTKALALQRIAEKDKAVTRSLREDKRKYLDGFAQDAEYAALSGNLREVYSTTKRLSVKFQLGDKPVRARDGKLLTSREEQKNRWKDQFAELLNHPPPDNPPNIEPAKVDLEIDLEPPSTRSVS
ncbi:endonuclease-reverse transcriptase [Elysia marginata]|uniref:Endonuclease-reverse transcriptase n=1 Tax=Elysia marginata TaxID=1093978 RepID=A0AAV4F6N1_9GAST|nr:endonuclease-reverse transcriptase [Elysia marginata]